MENLISDIISKKNVELSPLSVKTYSNCVNKVLEIINLKDFKALIIKPNEIINALNKYYDKPNTIKTKLASIIVFLRCIRDDKNKKLVDIAINIYSDDIEILSNKIRDALTTGEKSIRQQKGWITCEEHEALEKFLLSEVPKNIRTAKDLMKFRNYVIFKIYNDIPSRNDFADAKIIFKSKKILNDEYNYIILDKKNKKSIYQMNVYKTSKNYGQKNTDINNDLFNLLLKYKKSVDLFNDKEWFLLNDGSTDKITRNRLGVVYSNLGEHINKKLGTSLNRHQKISDLIPLQAIQNLADKMGNSPKQQLEVYAKI
jgi:hypothetical protein